MGINNPQKRIAQVFKYNKQNGIVVYSFYVSWHNDPIKFCWTKVIGAQPLSTNRCDPAKALGHCSSWDDMEANYQKLLKQGYQGAEPLDSEIEVWNIVQECRAKRDDSLDFCAKTANTTKVST